MYDETGKPILSPAAILDEEAHQAFIRKAALDLAAYKAPPLSPPPKRSEFVTQRELGRLLEKIGRAIKQELDRRMAEIEAKQLKLGGVWKASERYAENTLVSFQGGLWISRADTTARPGGSSPAWRLCVKKGDGAPA